MRKAKFQRIAAFLLALTFLLGGATLFASADESSVSDKTTEDIKALLNAISYDEYLLENAGVPKGGSTIVIDATKNVTYTTTQTTESNGKSKTEVVNLTPEYVTLPERGSTEEERKAYRDAAVKNNAYISTFDGVDGIFSPVAGTLTWEIPEITKDTPAALYSIEIVCYPIENKSASVERVFMINGNVPFAEARYITISKIWRNVYTDAKVEVLKGENADEIIASFNKLSADYGLDSKASKLEENGKTYVVYSMPEFWTEDQAKILNGESADGETVAEKLARFFTIDIDGNEIRSSLVQDPAWMTYTLKDSNGFLVDDFQFVIAADEEGKTTISLEAVNEPIVIKEIRLVPYDGYDSYEAYLNKIKEKNGGALPGAGKDKIKIEAEYSSAVSSQTIYPVSDTTSAINSPVATDRTVINSMGGDKWQSPGQWIEYKFRVKESGFYNISTRFKQSVLDGMYTSRALSIYSEGLDENALGYYNGIPFAEAGRLQFNYSSDWQSGKISDGSDGTFDIYFEKDVVYTLRFEVTLGNMGSVVSRVQESLNAVNADYLNILKLTGTSPDQYRDYGFSRVMPDTMIDMIKQARVLNEVAIELENAANVKSSMTATLEKVARLLEQMGKDDDEVAKNLEQLKTYIGSLGTWLSDAKTQPLMLDYIVIQSADDASVPAAKAGFFKTIAYEVVSFIKSFFRNYDRMGAMTEAEGEDVVEVWLAYGRDQSQVIRSLINNDFTPNTKVAVDLKLVSGGTLLPSILAQMGPDVYIGIGQSDVINYAIRGALLPIEDMEGFDEKYTVNGIEYEPILDDFNDAAMMVLGIEVPMTEEEMVAYEQANNVKLDRNDYNVKMHYYGLPETQNFTMMFVREDIFADLDLDIPKTWDDVKEAIPVLQANNMQIAMHNDCKIFLYQMGGELFADNGMRINLDSNVALDSFNTMCEMFTMYSFPYKYDFANRFRTGEMPLGFATYTSTYNQLKVFATEIEGLWGFYPMPGYADENGESINNVSVSTVTAISMMVGCENMDGAWKFMRWHVDEECQKDYSNEMVAILGPSAKHATANESALRELPWTAEELEQLEAQFNSLAAVPNYPGCYIVDRYTKFAFLSAYNDKADPVTELQSYIKIINTEITRKRQEFGLETLADGQTLAQKRMAEAEAKILAAKESDAYNAAYDETCNNILALIAGYTTEDFASLYSLSEQLRGLDGTLFAGAADNLLSAARALESYEAYK